MVLARPTVFWFLYFAHDSDHHAPDSVTAYRGPRVYSRAGSSNEDLGVALRRSTMV